MGFLWDLGSLHDFCKSELQECVIAARSSFLFALQLFQLAACWHIPIVKRTLLHMLDA